MNAKKLLRLLALSCAVLAGGAGVVRAYTFIAPSGNALRWPDGAIPMQLQLGSSGTLIDGSTSWNNVFESGLAIWNSTITAVGFTVFRNSNAPLGDGNGYNNAFFSSSIYGRAFGASTLAVTTDWYRNPATRVEADVIFNTAFSWNSYRGNLRSGVQDIRRVAIHEQGHVLGLDHPDQAGQSVSAIMNAFISNIDTVTADDIGGARALYGGLTLAPPGAPAFLTASASGSAVALIWGAPATGGAPSSYTVEAGSSPGLANLASFATGNTATSYGTSGVAPGIYFVRVRASNSAGTSAPSIDATLVVGSGGCATAPGAPGALITVFNAGGTVIVSWAPSGGAPSTYVIEAGTGPGLANLLVSDLGGTATSLTATAVSRGTYYVRVRGRNACGTSAPSNEISVIVP
jgi:hypothetical protein